MLQLLWTYLSKLLIIIIMILESAMAGQFHRHTVGACSCGHGRTIVRPFRILKSCVIYAYFFQYDRAIKEQFHGLQT